MKKDMKPWYETRLQQNRYWGYDSVHDFLYYAISEVHKLCKKHNIHYYLAYGTVLGAVRQGEIIPWDPDADIYVPAQELKRFIKIAREEFPEDLYIDFYDENPNYIYTHAKIGKKGFTSNGLHMDVFPLVGLPKGEKEQKFLTRFEWNRALFGMQQGNWGSRIPEINKWFSGKWHIRMWLLLRRFVKTDKIICQIDKLSTAYDLWNDCEKLFDGFRVFPVSFFGEGIKSAINGIESIIPQDYDGYLKQVYGDYHSYPDDRCFQSIIRVDKVNPDIANGIVAYIDTFTNITAEKIKKIEELYWKSGSIVAIVRHCSQNGSCDKGAITIAKSIRFFDKVLIDNGEPQNEEKLIDMVAPDLIIDAET